MMTCECYITKSKWLPSGEERYTVRIDKSVIPERISNFTVKDDPNKPVDFIEGVVFSSCINLLKIPKNMTLFFPNLVALFFNECDLIKISRCDLKGLQSLREVSFSKTNIEKLEGNFYFY